MRISKAEAVSRFADTTVEKLSFPGGWELATLWNAAADSFRVISFEPNCALKSNRAVGKGPMIFMETFCWAHIPLYYYRAVLSEREQQRYRQLVVQSVAAGWGATLKGDTIVRKVVFRDDSNLYLPQASYVHLGVMMENAMFSGRLHVYRTEQLGKPMSKWEVEQSFVHWDSTNAVEDPHRPGIFILAPIKTEARPVGIVVCEKWIPVAVGYDARIERAWQPQADMQYTRQVQAEGLLLSSGRLLWCAPPELGRALCEPAFSWRPYDECFRAERFETMHIMLRQ